MKRVVVTSPLRIFALCVGLSVILLGLDGLGLVGGIRGAFEEVFVPIERAVFSVSHLVRVPIETLRFWRTGVARIADLERQVAELTVDSVRLLAIEEENRAMRAMLGTPLPREWRFVPAPIIGRGDEMVLATGSQSGISEDQPVVWEDLLLGTVAQVTPNLSRVRLLSDPGSRIPVYLPATGADGLLEGRFGSQVVMTQVLQGQGLPIDAVVVTSGAFGPPRGFVVGKVERIVSDKTDVHQEAMVTPALDPFQLETVFVVIEQ